MIRLLPMLVALFVPALAHAALNLTVRLDPAATTAPISGRLVVALARDDSKISSKTAMTEAPFWDDWQPVFGTNVTNLVPGAAIILDDTADNNLVPISQLKPGRYRAAAWLVAARTTSSWKTEPGNIFSREVRLTIPDPKAAAAAPPDPVLAELLLTEKTSARPWPQAREGVALVELPSKLLAEFHHRPVTLRAGIVLPRDYDPKKTYAAVYEVPGFGGDHRAALTTAARRSPTPATNPAAARLEREVFWIVLNPESPNGHHLFADSDNNGPVGQALVSELIPAIEARFPALRAAPSSRLLRGHSSGGWSVLWLALNHPETFGAAFSSSPDPVDFRRFQTVDIYAAKNMYSDDAQPPTPTPSFRKGDKPVMTVRQENWGEMVLGPNQTSAQQWHSWQAVFGPRIGDRGWGNGHPAALYDAKSGVIDHAVAERYRRYDLADLLRTSPEKYLPIWRDRIRLVVGDLDSFYLNEAVALLGAELASRGVKDSITIVPGADHGSIYASPAIARFPADMLDYIDRAAPAPGR